MSDLIGVQDLHRAPAQTRPPASSEGAAPEGEENHYRLHRRFDRLGRLYGDGSVERLMSSRVVVFGLGGVGSFAAEALARSAIGHLMLVDFDDVCVTNANRQLQAMRGNIGQSKARVLAERLALVNPQADIQYRRQFYKAESADELLATPAEWGGDAYDFVVDCIDNMTAKAHLLATCAERGIPVVSSMGAAGRRDPTQIRVADLRDTEKCPMARELRKILRKKYGFEADAPFGVPSVYSIEKRSWPRELSYDGGEGFRCVCPHKSDEHGCDNRSLIDGTVAFVTGAFGLTVASHVVNRIAEAVEDRSAPGPDRFGYRPATPR